ncbi:MAG: hypothetical protein D6819_01660 [Gammaproteobacteria bacterium]|nr:MAG: hypothetical protein D6819_01660 [Gammaproteobacteria bacterium]
MNKVAIIVLAGTEGSGDLGRVVNALEAVKEFKEAGDEVRLIFDGAGTQWIPELARAEHRYHPLFDAVSDRIAGACRYCAQAFGVKEAVEGCAVPLLGEFEGHPSFRQLVTEGFQVITF